MKKVLIILIGLVSLHAKAQMLNIFADEFPDSAKLRIGIVTEYGLNSNAFTNQFVTQFYKGGYIDTDLKNEVLGRTKNTNRIGADFNSGIYVAIKPDSLFHKKHLSLFFGVRDRQHFDARFSKDFYKVGFYGNSQFAGETANFNNFNLNLLRYQQLQIGFFSTKLDSATRWGMSISFLKGEQYASILAKKAELFTSEDGQYIDFNTSIQVAQSDTARKGLGAFNGYGASVDIYLEAPFNTRFGISKLRVSIEDVGLIRFNDRSLQLKQDSLFHYTGFTINSIYDLQDSTFKGTSQDSIFNTIVPFQKQSFSVTIPATLNLSFETQFNKHFHLVEGIRYVFNANHTLLAYVKGVFYINPRLMLSTTFGYGGYGRFNYGLGIFAKLGKGFLVYAGSNNIEGYIAPKKTTGQGAYISLIKNFK
ncbi:MAG: hypothetical protein ACT4ON_12445 [Bacteroidota bacterium]